VIKLSIFLTGVFAFFIPAIGYSAESLNGDAWAKNKGTIFDACDSSWKVGYGSKTLGQLSDGVRDEVDKHKGNDPQNRLWIAEEQLLHAAKLCAAGAFKKEAAKKSGAQLLYEIMKLRADAFQDNRDNLKFGCHNNLSNQSANLLDHKADCAMYGFRISQIGFIQGLIYDGLIDAKSNINYNVLDDALKHESESSKQSIASWSSGSEIEKPMTNSGPATAQ
jgi:hypothetical protein